MQVYNTLSRKKEVLPQKKIKLFVCGVTPYDFSHIGHARTYVAFDIIVKYLRQIGREVYYLQNVTDVEDKIIERAKKEKKTPLQLARYFELLYYKDMKALGVTAPNQYARATVHIPEIISQVKRLVKKGYAYIIENDGVYYDIAKFKGYGKLSGRTVLQAQDATTRIDESVNKKNKGDFALWKFSKPGEPKWSLAVARDGSTIQMDGRPGWHIEDTAITEKYFGAQYDIHGGGIDLVFPHHEAEIAQMEAISGKVPLAKYWVHTGFLTVGGEKMSKSLGNFITIQDFLQKHSARVLRFLVLKTHYRSPLDYSEKAILQAEKELQRIDEFVSKLKAQSTKSKISSKLEIQKFQTEFHKVIQDDFNTPKALAVLFDCITQANKELAQGTLNTKEVLAFVKEIDAVFGVLLQKTKKVVVSENAQSLLQKREKYRKQGNWEKADLLRKQLATQGFVIQDTPKGPVLKKI